VDKEASNAGERLADEQAAPPTSGFQAWKMLSRVAGYLVALYDDREIPAEVMAQCVISLAKAQQAVRLADTKAGVS
jgi:hypothetical protein